MKSASTMQKIAERARKEREMTRLEFKIEQLAKEGEVHLFQKKVDDLNQKRLAKAGYLVVNTKDGVVIVWDMDSLMDDRNVPGPKEEIKDES